MPLDVSARSPKLVKIGDRETPLLLFANPPSCVSAGLEPSAIKCVQRRFCLFAYFKSLLGGFAQGLVGPPEPVERLDSALEEVFAITTFHRLGVLFYQGVTLAVCEHALPGNQQ